MDERNARAASHHNGLSLQDLTITRQGRRLLQITHHIAPGECLTIMGPSGSGKSSLLAAITGQLAPELSSSGRIWLAGQDITHLPPQRRRIGILYQDHLLFPHLSVGGNLAFGLARRSHRNRRATVERALQEVGLEGFHDRDPASLSGGQKARVALMRMLLCDPSALLLDEPFTGLDTAMRAQIRALVFRFAKDRNLPLLLVTHDQDDADFAKGPLIYIDGDIDGAPD